MTKDDTEEFRNGKEYWDCFCGLSFKWVKRDIDLHLEYCPVYEKVAQIIAVDKAMEKFYD